MDFRRLWAGQTASQLGAHSAEVILPLVAVVALGAGSEQVGWLRAAQQLPVLLLTLFAGAWADRARTRDVMLAADLGRALVLAAVPAAALTGVLGMPLLLVAALLAGALGVYFDVAYQAALVRLVPRERLARANAALESTRSAAQIAGPALGGALVSLLTAPFALAASAGCFLASFLAIGRIGAGAPPAVRQARSIRAGLRFVLGEPVLRAVGIASALFQVAFAAQLTVYVLFLPRTLHLSGAEIGLVMAALGPGAIAGSLLSARLPPRYGYGTVMVSAAAIGEAVLLAVPALHGSSVLTVMALAAVNVVFGACGQLVDVSVMTVRQARTPVAIQGRVVATINFVGMGLMPLGSLAAGYLAAALGIRTALVLTTLALLLSPLYMAVSPLRKLGGHEVFSAQT